MTTDTSDWPQEARRLLAWINARRLAPEQDYPGGYDGVGPRRDLEALVSRLCPDPEAHGPADVCGKPLMEGWSNRCDRPAGHDGLCEGPARVRAAQTRPTVPIEFEDDDEPRGEPARQPCDEEAPGSMPPAEASTQALDSEPQEPDEPEWVRVAPSIAEALSALQSLYYAQMVREALRERAELLRALDTITERASRLESERDEARAEVDRLRAELASVRADFFASQRG